MAIIVSKNGRNAEKIDQSNFALENKLQEYIYDNPDTIPLYDIDEDTRLFIAAREFSTKSGPIDALGFDARGNIYVVETKLYKNPDKRTVVAQALDYGASLWRHAVDFDEFLRQLDSHTQKQFGSDFQQKYTEFFSLEESSDQVQSIRANLADGSIKFVVLMDKLHDALKDLVVFVNQNSKFDLYAVELEYYKHKEFEIIIPKLFGSEVKKDVSTVASKSKWQWQDETEADFLQRSREECRVDQSLRITDIEKLIQLAKEMGLKIGGRVQYGNVVSKTRNVGKLILNNSIDRAVFYLDSDGSLGFYMFDPNSNFDKFNKSVREKIVNRNLLGKGTSSLEANQILLKLKGSSQEDVIQLMNIISNEIELNEHIS